MVFICVSELGHHWLKLWLVACPASRHYVNGRRRFANCTLGNKLSKKIQIFPFNKMHLIISSAKWQPYCLGLNVLTVAAEIKHPGVYSCRNVDTGINHDTVCVVLCRIAVPTTTAQTAYIYIYIYFMWFTELTATLYSYVFYGTYSIFQQMESLMTLGSISIRLRSKTVMSDWCRIDVDPRGFAIRISEMQSTLGMPRTTRSFVLPASTAKCYWNHMLGRPWARWFLKNDREGRRPTVGGNKIRIVWASPCRFVATSHMSDAQVPSS